MHSNREKRIFKNTALLYFRMAFTMLLGIYTSRIVLQALGVSDYGLFNVVGGVTTMFLFLNGSMSVATSRFISYEMGHNNKERLAATYNQARLIHWCIAAVVFLLIETIGLWFLNNNMNIPDGRMDAANWVLHTVAITSVLNIIATPDISLVISHEKMSSFAYISIFDATIRFLFTYFLLSYNHDRLILYAILMMLIQVADRLFYLIYCHRNFKECRTRVKLQPEIFKSMLSFAGWNIMGNLALIIIDQGINIVLNIFYGTIVNAARGIAMQISNYSNAFVTNVRMAINPQITKSYASGDINFMVKLIKYSSLSCYYLLLLIAAVLYWVIDYILKIWLIEVPEHTSIFINLTLLYLIVNSFGNPVIIGIHATGHIRKFQIVEGSIMLLTLPLAYILLKCDYPPYCVYVAQIAIAIATQAGRLYVILPELRIRFRTYLTQIIVPAIKVAATTIAASVAFSLLRHTMSETGYNMTQCMITTAACLLSIMYLGLDKDERTYLYNLLRKRI